MDEKGKSKLKGVWYRRPIICEEKEIDGERKTFIVGNAVEVGVSRNKVQYTPEELKVAAQSLIGKPLLLNHGDTDVRNIVGKVTHAIFENNGVPFRAEMDSDEHTILNKLRKGLINSVSIGADYESIDVDADGIKHPKGLEFLELSLVPIPGIANATISQVIQEKFEAKKLEDEKMEEEKLKQEIEDLKKKDEELTAKNDELLSQVKEDEEEKPDKEEDESSEPEKPEESAVAKLTEKLAELEKKIEQQKGIVEAAETKEKAKIKIIREGKDTKSELPYDTRNTVFWGVDKDGKLLY